ncbi:MAG: hypothetical protein U9Q20_08300 [Campylobacterota bacterium]|nr:hypothetical protein [Campylobacterota bacterium]
MFEKEEVKVFRPTIKLVINNLATIKDCEIDNLEDMIEEKFSGYDYEGEDEIIGYEKWPDISTDGEYQLPVKVNHEDAYELTLHVSIKNKKATVTNVL